MKCDAKVLIVGALPRSIMLNATLADHGMVVTQVSLTSDVLAWARSVEPDVIVVAPSKAEPDQHYLVSSLAHGGDCGIIVIADRRDEAAQNAYLQSGADDCLSAPVTASTITTHVLALLRRFYQSGLRAASPRIVVYVDERLIVTPNHLCSMTAEELVAVTILLEAKGAPVSRQLLFMAAFHRKFVPGDGRVGRLISGLSGKLTQHGLAEHSIMVVGKLGFCLPGYHLFYVVPSAAMTGEPFQVLDFDGTTFTTDSGSALSFSRDPQPHRNSIKSGSVRSVSGRNNL